MTLMTLMTYLMTWHTWWHYIHDDMMTLMTYMMTWHTWWHWWHTWWHDIHDDIDDIHDDILRELMITYILFLRTLRMALKLHSRRCYIVECSFGGCNSNTKPWTVSNITSYYSSNKSNYLKIERALVIMLQHPDLQTCKCEVYSLKFFKVYKQTCIRQSLNAKRDSGTQ